MQCSSYIPVCYPTKDINATESDRTWPQNDNGTNQINGQVYDNLFTPCNTSQYQGNQKEILRQIMVQQEATFKDQVNELHRLYKRQRDLMDELNMRELPRDNTEGKTSTTAPVLSQNLSELTQTSHITSLTLEDASRHCPSSFNFQPPSNFDARNSKQAGSNISVHAGIGEDLIFMPSNGKKNKKRTFNLQLPADQYIDCEEERFEELNASIGSQASDVPSSGISATYHQSSSQFFSYNSQSNHSEGNSSGTGISNLADLNKTFRLEKESTLYSTSHPGLHNCMSRSMPVATQALPYFGWPANSWLDNKVCLNRNSMCDPRSPSVGSLQNTLLPRLEYSTSRTGPHGSTSLELNNAVVRSAEEVDSASIISGGLSNLAVQDTFRGCHWLGDTTGLNRITINGKESLKRVGKCQIDLNSSLNEDGSIPVEVEMKIAAAPVSPGNNEFSLPRCNSDEKQLTKFVKFTVQEDGCPKQDVAMIAAETLVSFLSTGSNATSELHGISFARLWFLAGIASSAAYVRENENETFLSSGADSNNSELICGGINEYAATIPQLKDMNLGENCCNQKKRIGSSSTASQPKKKRTRRTRSHKEIQRDIPPCVTSPSKHEMFEELHKIDRLKENEGKTSSSKKKLSDTRKQKGKKHASTSLSFVAEGSFPRQLTHGTKFGLLEGCPPAWGKWNKRGQRFRARNVALI